MKRFFLAALACGVLAAGSVPGHAATETVTYVAFGRAVLTVSQASAGVGGYTFVPASDPTSIKVVDGNGPGVAVMVCQEAGAAEDVPGSCQDAASTPPGDDVVQKFCSTANAVTLNAAFVKDVNLGVFVWAADASMRAPACATRGSTGTMTLTRA